LLWDFTLEQNLTSLEWNPNGSLLGLTCKDKTINIFDPRLQEGDEKRQLKVLAHEGNKTQKMVWMSNNDYILSTGFSKTNERQFKVWDLRAFTKE